ncbi:MAG: hypothetical protein FWG62_05715 [Proteobacteria bacterium]|nr:hypothetical protein [Pseudomonadota bacterium]
MVRFKGGSAPSFYFVFKMSRIPGRLASLLTTFFVCSYFRQAKFSMVGRGVERVKNLVGNRVSSQSIPDLFLCIFRKKMMSGSRMAAPARREGQQRAGVRPWELFVSGDF